MPLGQTTLMLAGVDDERPDAALLRALVSGAVSGEIRLLDLVIVRRRTISSGVLYEVDHDDLALMGLPLAVPGMIGVDDAATLCAHVSIGAAAALILVGHPAVAQPADWPPTALRARLIGVWPVPVSAADLVLEAARARAVSGAVPGRRAFRSRRPVA
ncbi:DUF6325 family protein [Microbacterium esteraromaticum]|uniref:DUF6325 family protein n=1 Tax=Microbacterium esteraromaticum TaxID=57043 RepID=UPI0019D3F809|nr:DUF6325 family protein [Microbacterium esteraromaticum]MBN7792464.1 hypothetical protein [Microbacterium esteraromaticum]